MTLNQVQTYVTGVLKGWITNKKLLDKISETSSGNLIYNDRELQTVTSSIMKHETLLYNQYVSSSSSYSTTFSDLKSNDMLIIIAECIESLTLYNGFTFLYSFDGSSTDAFKGKIKYCIYYKKINDETEVNATFSSTEGNFYLSAIKISSVESISIDSYLYDNLTYVIDTIYNVNEDGSTTTTVNGYNITMSITKDVASTNYIYIPMTNGTFSEDFTSDDNLEFPSLDNSGRIMIVYDINQTNDKNISFTYKVTNSSYRAFSFAFIKVIPANDSLTSDDLDKLRNLASKLASGKNNQVLISDGNEGIYWMDIEDVSEEEM